MQGDTSVENHVSNKETEEDEEVEASTPTNTKPSHVNPDDSSASGQTVFDVAASDQVILIADFRF
jgi:hypothetical protein